MVDKFNLMVSTANEKYAKVIDSVFQAKEDGSKENFDRIFKLIHSIYNDEIELIAKLCEAEKKEEKEPIKKEIQVFGFMVR